MTDACRIPLTSNTLAVRSALHSHFRTNSESLMKLPKMNAPIGRVYFDTSILWQQRWPSASGTKLDALAKLTQKKSIELCVPAPVRVEHRLKWMRELMDAWRAAKGSIEKASLIGKSGNVHTRVTLEPELLDEAKLGHSYEQAEADATVRLSMTVSPYTTRPLDWFVAAATRRLPPFVDTKGDRGFRDAVIFQSVLHDLKERPLLQAVAVLLTLDTDLKPEGVKPQIVEEQVPLYVLGSIDDLEKALQKQLTPEEREQWNKQSQMAKEFLDAQDLSELRERVMVGLRDRSLGLVKVLYVADVKLQEPMYSHVSPPPDELPSDISISFAIDAIVLGTVSTPPFVADSGIWFRLVMNVEATAQLTADNTLTDFTLKSSEVAGVGWMRDGDEDGPLSHVEEIEPPIELQ